MYEDPNTRGLEGWPQEFFNIVFAYYFGGEELPPLENSGLNWPLSAGAKVTRKVETFRKELGREKGTVCREFDRDERELWAMEFFNVMWREIAFLSTAIISY